MSCADAASDDDAGDVLLLDDDDGSQTGQRGVVLSFPVKQTH